MAGYVHGSMMSNGLDSYDNVVFKPWLVSDRDRGHEPGWLNRSAGVRTRMAIPGSCGDGVCCGNCGKGGTWLGGPSPPPFAPRHMTKTNPRAHDFTHDVPYGFGAPSTVGRQTPATRALGRRVDAFHMGAGGPIVNPGVSNPNSVSWDPTRRETIFQSSI